MAAAGLAAAVVAMVVVVGGSFNRAEAAPVDTVTGSAFALSVAGPGGPILAATPTGVEATVIGSSGGFGPIQRSQSMEVLPGLLTVDELAAAATGNLAAATHASSVTSNSTVVGISIAAILTAAKISSSCTATPNAVSGSALIEGANLGGYALPLSPSPNSVVGVPGVLVATLNEQTAVGPPGATSIVVRAIHLQVMRGAAGGSLLDVVIAQSQCALTSGQPTNDTTTPTNPAPPAPLTTIGTRVLPPAMTISPTTLAPTAAVPVTAVPATTVPPTIQSPTALPTLTVRTPRGAVAGPPGADVGVSGGGYSGCPVVRISFGTARIGSVHPNRSGEIHGSGLAVPGDASPGHHLVTASCQQPTALLTRSVSFEVTTASVHRSAFVTSIPAPSQIPLGAKPLARSVLVTAAAMLMIAFPSELFNSTLDANYAEVRGWLGLRPIGEPRVRKGHRLAEFTGFVLFGGVLYGLLSPGFGFNKSSVALAVGLAVSLVVISVVFRLPSLLHVHRRYREWGQLQVLPGTALVAVVCVAMSRLLHLQPGYMYGLIAGLGIRQRLARETSGRLTAVAVLLILGIGTLSWVVRDPVAAAAARPGAGFWLVAGDACLSAIFVLGLESVVMCLIPLRFLEGGNVTAWSRTAWTLVFGLGMLAFVHILLTPTSGYVAAGGNASRLTVFGIFAAFGLFSIGFWAYFRSRAARREAAVT